MYFSKKIALILFSSMTLGTFVSCTKKVESRPNFIFKPAPNNSDAFKFNNEVVSNAELAKGIESDIYDAEYKVYETKLNKVKGMIIEKLINMDTRKGSLSADEYLEKYITKGKGASDKEVEEFAKERNIPTDHMDQQMKERIKTFLGMEIKRKIMDEWMSEQTNKYPVEIYLTRPVRPVFEVNVGDSPFVGKADAKVTIVEFSDFQCPYCSKGREVMDELKKKYGDKIKIVFKNFPLPFHNQARDAAHAALCAAEQEAKAFWKMHDSMFSDQSKLDKESLNTLAKKHGLKIDIFKACVDGAKHMSKIDADLEEGKKVGIKSTPTFFVNGQLVNGAHPVEVFSEIIDEQMNK